MKRAALPHALEANPTRNGLCTAWQEKGSARLDENSQAMEVLRPKELDTHPGEEIVLRPRGQLEIGSSIRDNPGGGLLSATQTIGPVRRGLKATDRHRAVDVGATRHQAEGAGAPVSAFGRAGLDVTDVYDRITDRVLACAGLVPAKEPH